MTTYDTSTITITDTGKRRTSSVSSEETDIVNSGSAITLSGISITLTEKALLSKSPAVNLLSNSSDAGSLWKQGEIDISGIQNSFWSITGIINLDNAEHRSLLNHLRNLTKTKGYKTLSGDLPDLVDGVDDNSTVDVYVESIKITQTSRNNILAYSISLWETS